MDRHNSFEFFEDEEEESRIDLIETQKSIFTQIFNLVHESNDEEEQDVEVGDGQKIDKRMLAFKVLVYDQQASNILATIMKVGSLRENNIALHLNLNSKRDQIPDLPAIYLICKS